eukprot:m.184325 g.184325  ORF g.184325 m.184325 type:complete len:53 (-) comp16904_c0_seq10:3881-4039(-)
MDTCLIFTVALESASQSAASLTFQNAVVRRTRPSVASETGIMDTGNWLSVCQ